MKLGVDKDMRTESVISATSHTSRILADGTLQITMQIEPDERDKAIRLFGHPGTPIAVARINDEAARKTLNPETTKAQGEKKKAGVLAIMAYQLCADTDFWWFLHTDSKYSLRNVSDERGCAEALKAYFGIQSRRDLDNTDGKYDVARKKFAELRTAFAEWKRGRDAR